MVQEPQKLVASKPIPNFVSVSWFLVAVLCISWGLLDPGTAVAQSRTSLVISPDCADIRAGQTLQKEIALRLDPQDLTGWSISWVVGDDGCVLNLSDHELKLSSPLPRWSDEEIVRDAVVSLAWFITMHEPEEAIAQSSRPAQKQPEEKKPTGRTLEFRAAAVLNERVPGGSLEAGVREGAWSLGLVAEELFDAPAPGPPKHSHDVTLLGLQAGWTAFEAGNFRTDALLGVSVVDVETKEAGHDKMPQGAVMAGGRLSYRVGAFALVDATIGYREHFGDKPKGEPRLSGPMARLGVTLEWESPW